MVADVCKNHRGETVFVVKSAQGKLFILPHFCHPSILNHHPSPSCLSVLDRTSHLAMAYWIKSSPNMPSLSHIPNLPIPSPLLIQRSQDDSQGCLAYFVHAGTAQMRTWRLNLHIHRLHGILPFCFALVLAPTLHSVPKGVTLPTHLSTTQHPPNQEWLKPSWEAGEWCQQPPLLCPHSN